MKTLLMLLFIGLSNFVFACAACEKQQPKITRGFTHGIGPQSNWDWVIVAVITVIKLLTFLFSIKFLIKTREKKNDHNKQKKLKY